MFRVFDINQNGIVTKDELMYAAGGQDKYVEEII
jgi:Ca2+-binding EF-hand superfamily protein